jgi:hypothetical protein
MADKPRPIVRSVRVENGIVHIDASGDLMRCTTLDQFAAVYLKPLIRRAIHEAGRTHTDNERSQ